MRNPRNILVSAGETSGDLHAAALLRHLKNRLPHCAFWGMGGQALRSEGLEAIVPMEAVEVMGLVEVLGSLPRVRRAMNVLADAAAERKPAAAVLTDFADFHFGLAGRLKRLGIPVVYFISPKLWAWREGRVRQVKRLVDLMISVLPFERQFYSERGFENVYYAGNPLVDELAAYLEESPEEAADGLGLERAGVIAVLPGSRKREIECHSGPFLAAARLAVERLGGEAQIVAALPDKEKAGLFASLAGGGIRVLAGRARRLLRASRVALVASGTATLEAGLLGTPAVVGYRVNPLSYLVGRMLIKGIRFISLVNLVLDREVFPEFIQRLDAEEMAAALVGFWDGESRERVAASLGELRDRMGPAGTLDRAAEEVASFVGGLA